MSRKPNENRLPGHAARHLHNGGKKITRAIEEGVHAAESLREAAHVGAREVRDTAADIAVQGREQVSLLQHHLAQRIAARPFKAILVTAAAGFLAGLCIRRR